MGSRVLILFSPSLKPYHCGCGSPWRIKGSPMGASGVDNRRPSCVSAFADGGHSAASSRCPLVVVVEVLDKEEIREHNAQERLDALTAGNDSGCGMEKSKKFGTPQPPDLGYAGIGMASMSVTREMAPQLEHKGSRLSTSSFIFLGFELCEESLGCCEVGHTPRTSYMLQPSTIRRPQCPTPTTILLSHAANAVVG